MRAERVSAFLCGRLPHNMLSFRGGRQGRRKGGLTVTTQTQNARLDVRLAQEHKKMIEEAAALLGQTVSTFTVATLLREAGRVMERFGTITLTRRDRDAFMALLDNPPEPNARLRRAFQEHARRVRQ